MATDRSSNQPPPATPSGETVVISPAMRKRLQRCFERGKEVTRQEKPDYDYAHTMYTECVLNDPANLDYVEAMLENLQRKYKNNKRGSRLRGFGGRGAFKKAVAAEDWSEVFRQGLELLRTNPWDVATLRALASACQANHYNEVELRYLKNALDVNRKDIEVNRHCAESLSRMGQFDQAIACWHRIEELDKGHDEARRKISELTLAKQRGLPGLETTTGVGKPATSRAASPSSTNTSGPASGSSPPAKPPLAANQRDNTANSAASVEAMHESIEPNSDRIASLEKALAHDEADLELYRELGEMYTEAGRLREAFQVFKRGLEASGGHNLKLRELVEDAQIRMVRGQVAIAEKRAAAEKTVESQELAKRFRTELNRQELAVLASRSDRYPHDLSLKFELGIRLKREENFREARGAFEAARAEPKLRGLATLELGECFQHLRQYGNAAKCYQAAVEQLETNSEPYKLALYRGGVLATALKNLDAARKALEQLWRIDPNFRDVASRLDKLSRIGDKE